MYIAGSLQLSHDLGICKSYGRRDQFMSVVGTGRLHLLSVSLSSLASQQDAWSSCLSESVHRPIHFLPSRYHVFISRSSLIPARASEIPILKNAAMALMRSSNVLHGGPLAIQLVPAFGIIAFAIWGLGPLTRWSRNLFLHKSDSSWKKSATYYITTSYVQPLLLWTGATLICRVLDPVVLPTEASQAVKQRLLNFVRSLSTVLAFAYCVSSLIQHAQQFFIETNDSSDTRNMGFQFAGKAMYTAVWVAAVSLFMELLGYSTQKWVTAGGLGTVLLTLAGREIFTNFLSSVMIHATRPFVVNEWIQTKIEGYEVSGTVEHVGWWSPTIIRGDDREAVHIPNHKFTVNVVRNLSQKTHWRIKTHIAISHLDVNKINNIVADMRKVLAKNPQVEQQRLHRRVFLENIDPENQALLILVSCFVKTSRLEEYLCVKEAILLDLLRVIGHHRARLATPIRTFQKIYTDPDMDNNIPFSETVFTHAGAPTNRPFLLIEPPYKINGNDKAKAQARSVRKNEEHDAKADTISANDTKADTKAGSTPKSDPQVDIKIAVESKKDAKGAVILTSDSKNPESDNPVQNNSQNREHKKVNLGDERQNTKVDNVTTNVSTPLPNSSAIKAGGTKKEPPPMARTALGENIFLGVALEGSKRTLPIDDDMTSPPTSEVKDLAASRNRSGSPSPGKDKKDGQTPAVPGSATSGQRDQER